MNDLILSSSATWLANARSWKSYAVDIGGKRLPNLVHIIIIIIIKYAEDINGLLDTFSSPTEW